MFTELFYFYGNLKAMKCFFLPLFVIVFFFSCAKKEEKYVSRDISRIWIKNILTDSTRSIRTLDIIDNNIYYAANNGRFGIILKDGGKVIDNIKLDSLIPSFRASGYNNKGFFILSIGTPGLIYKYTKHPKFNLFTEESSLVYQETHSKVFYDSMDFWNDQEGIAIGDPTDDCMSIIITRDGGDTWTKLSCDALPKAEEGEAAFAASDTNIAIVGDHTWVATGGKASRILYSPNKGETWEVFDTPIIQGAATTGMYSIDFYDTLNGFAIGGNYTKPDENTANKIRTSDGGKTWELVAQNENPGYRSCVQYIPNGKGKELVAIGFKGIDYSNDSGNSWKHLSDEGFYTIRFLNDTVAYAAGKGRISKLTFRE